jgi:uncharacterized protein (DUF433 family)
MPTSPQRDSDIYHQPDAGMSIAEIVDAYPSLTEETIRGVLVELAHWKDFQPA